jgi:pyranose oxidase
MRTSTSGADVVIVGTGPVAAVLARILLNAGVHVLMLEAGRQMSTPPGAHLRNAFACQIDPSFFNETVKAHLRPASMSTASGGSSEDSAASAGSANRSGSKRGPRTTLPAARVTNLVGGMGALWNCVALRMDEELKHWPGISSPEWDSLYAAAEDLLGVSPSIFASSPRQTAVLNLLSERYREPSRPFPRPAAIAARRRSDNPELIRWTGPAEILGDTTEELRTGSLRIWPDHAVNRLIHRGGQITQAEVQGLDPWESKTISGEVFVVAGGAIRTPALLWNSGIGKDGQGTSCLGRYLCDHPLAYAQVALNPELLAQASNFHQSRLLNSETDLFISIPFSSSKPFHSLIMPDVHCDKGQPDNRAVVSLYWYSLATPRFENRMVFNESAHDSWTLPQPTFEYTLFDEDRARIQVALEDLKNAGQMMGSFLPSAPPQILSPGSSMHIMGTTRMGDNDGGSLVDSYGQVWGFSNLYLGGTGLIPCATASNPTLTACALAVRTAQKILDNPIIRNNRMASVC